MNNSIGESAAKYVSSHIQVAEELKHLEVPESVRASAKDCIIHMYRILAASASFESMVDAQSIMLELGCKRFGSDYAVLLKPISGEVYEVRSGFGREGIFVGQHFTLEESLRAYSQNKPTIVDLKQIDTLNMSTSAYNQLKFRAYLGIPVKFAPASQGVLCFFWDEYRQTSVASEDVFILDLMAEGIACMASLQNNTARRSREDMAAYASGSMQSLEEYQAMAQLIDLPGIAGKVTETLRRRVGQASLNIDAIAEELRLSKRTLQRRLQQQDSSFAEIRDKVRFHFAIDLLVKQQLSVDKISTVLDFSDRTSFTNAFKRWTGLSPSTFRKVFRDYA